MSNIKFVQPGSNFAQFSNIKKLEIKPCGLASKIRDMEADLIYW